MTFRRSLIGLTLVVAVLMTAAGPAHAWTRSRDLRHRMLSLVNRSRHAHGLGSLRLNARVSRYASHHSQRMAGQRTLYHSSSVWPVVRSLGAQTWGENVGMSGSLKALERAFMASPTHRANNLAARFHKIGVGVVRAHGTFWVTLDFYGA
jgi:uncharacterized protein YkwD